MITPLVSSNSSLNVLVIGETDYPSVAGGL